MTATAPKFAEVKVGDALKPIVLPPISRHQLALYCGGSGDHNPIHVDSTSPRSSVSRTCSPTACCRWPSSAGSSPAMRRRSQSAGSARASPRSPGWATSSRLSGKVTGKREESGEKLIDLEVKCTNQNGQDTLQGHATVAAA